MVGRTRDARIRCLASWCIQKNHNQSYGEEGSYGRKHDHDLLDPCWWLNNRNWNNNLVRLRVSWKGERGTTQGTLGEVTLNVDFVVTTPHLYDSSCEWFETHGALRDGVFDSSGNAVSLHLRV